MLEMGNEIKTYCIIVTYNGQRWIRKCLDSILHGQDMVIRPVVVDNGSTDGTVPVIREEYPEAVLLENGMNTGFGRANNRGIEYAYKEGATHFLLLNQDATLLPGAVRTLVDAQQEGNLPIVSPVHMNGTGQLLDQGFFRCIAGNRELSGDLFRGCLKTYYPCPFVNAACWLLPRETVERIGGFDPVYFHYGEDIDYCSRVVFHGGTVGVVPGAVMWHDREEKGNWKAWEKAWLSTSLIKMYGIRPTPFRDRVKYHFQQLKVFIFDLLTFHFRDAGLIGYGYREFFKRVPMIRSHVRQNRTIGPNWLSL